jgi:hypothetical protein
VRKTWFGIGAERNRSEDSGKVEERIVVKASCRVLTIGSKRFLKRGGLVPPLCYLEF